MTALLLMTLINIFCGQCMMVACPLNKVEKDMPNDILNKTQWLARLGDKGHPQAQNRERVAYSSRLMRGESICLENMSPLAIPRFFPVLK